MSDSVWPHRQQPTRFPCPWDSPGENTGVGCHFLLQCMKVKSESEVTQLCPTLSDPMDCSPPGSSIHGSFQARALEWVPCINTLHAVLNCFSHVQLCDPMDHSPPGSSVHGILSPGKNTGMSCHALLQGIFLTQGSNPCLLCLLHWQAGPLPLAPPGKPHSCSQVHLYSYIATHVFRYIYIAIR